MGTGRHHRGRAWDAADRLQGWVDGRAWVSYSAYPAQRLARPSWPWASRSVVEESAAEFGPCPRV